MGTEVVMALRPSQLGEPAGGAVAGGAVAGGRRALTVDRAHLGTPEEAWQASGRLGTIAPLALRAWRRVVVVAPHPDDEILGAGGLIGTLTAGGTPIEIVAVTDGEGSHPGSRVAAAVDLPARRAAERAEALRRLTGLRAPHPRLGITRLGLPDSAVAAHEDALRARLTGLVRADDLLVAPWAHDGHRDHDSAGRAALHAGEVRGCDVISYLVWAWHWADPEAADDIPWASCRRLPLSRRDAARKRWATVAFVSQIRALGPEGADGPVLPDAVLRRSWRRSEIFAVRPPP